MDEKLFSVSKSSPEIHVMSPGVLLDSLSANNHAAQKRAICLCGHLHVGGIFSRSMSSLNAQTSLFARLVRKLFRQPFAATLLVSPT